MEGLSLARIQRLVRSSGRHLSLMVERGDRHTDQERLLAKVVNAELDKGVNTEVAKVVNTEVAKPKVVNTEVAKVVNTEVTKAVNTEVNKPKMVNVERKKVNTKKIEVLNVNTEMNVAKTNEEKVFKEGKPSNLITEMCQARSRKEASLRTCLGLSRATAWLPGVKHHRNLFTGEQGGRQRL